MKFNRKELKLLEQLCKEYIQAKELVSKAEVIDRNSGANIQINKEFRDAFSHLIRIFGDILLVNGKNKKKEPEYYYVNIDKAIGHVYRAGYDALDGISISLRENINQLSQFPTSTITQIVPNYAEKIDKLNKFHELLVKIKGNKDIGNDSSHVFRECIAEMNNIEISMQGINEAIPLMKELEKEKSKDKKFTLIQGLLFMAGGVVLGGALGYLISSLTK